MFVRFVVIAALFFGAVLAKGTDDKKTIKSPATAPVKSSPSKADDDSCKKLSNAQVEALFNKWNNNL